jgi:D-amino-acid oxidase
MSNIAVIGAGVVGLSTAHELLENGHKVTVVAAEPPLNTTSAVATAIWHVYMVDPGDRQVRNWAQVTLERLVGIAGKEPAAGVSITEGIHLFRRTPRQIPTWSDIALSFTELTATELEVYPGTIWGYRIRTPLAEMDRYLAWLYRSVWRLGGHFVLRGIDAIEELEGNGFDGIVNCAGLGARKLTNDDELAGVRGQYLVLEKPAGIPDFFVGDDENPLGVTYVVPRANDVLVGGTKEHGVDTLAFEESVPAFIERASQLCDWLGVPDNIAVRQKVVGIRPYRRSGVRLELTSAPLGTPLVHNYGHGGAGFSLSWGCARAIRELLSDAMNR